MENHPRGLPAPASDAALALMRLSLAGMLAFISVARDGDSSPISVLSALMACLIAAGFLTRLAAAIFTLAGLLSTAFGGTPLTYAPLIGEGLALLLLGPGAWSIDAHHPRRGLRALLGRSPGDP